MTPTTVGWVIADGGVDDCPTVSGDELGIARGDGGLDAVSMAASAAGIAERVHTMVAAGGDRLHGVGLTWSDDAAVAAALLLESLADAGFDNVVPVRFSQAAASLTSGISLRGEASAVCVIEPGLATLVLPDGSGDEGPVVVSTRIGGTDDVIGWLAEAFASRGLRPEVLMLAGSIRGLDRLGRRLESRLSVPVFVQVGAQQALARGAALAAGAHTDLAGRGAMPVGSGVGSTRSRPLSYTGALVMLAGGAVTFVASLSAALSLQLGPGNPVRPVEHATVARVAVPAAPATSPPAAPAPRPELPEAPVEFGALWEGPAVIPGEPEAAPNGPRSMLERVREHIPRLPGR